MTFFFFFADDKQLEQIIMKFHLKRRILHLKSLIAIGFDSENVEKKVLSQSLFNCFFTAPDTEDFLSVTVNEMMALFSSYVLMV